MSGVDNLVDLRDSIREARLSASAFRMGASNSRWRPSPSSVSFYGQDIQISEGSLQTSYAVAAELLLTHPQVETALRAAIAISKVGQLMPEPDTDDPELNALLSEEGWKTYAEDPVQCDVEAKYNYYQLSEQALYLTMGFGDSPTPIDRQTRLMVCEPWRLRSPSRSSNPKYGTFGVQRDSEGHEVIGYWLTKEPKSPWDMVKVNEVEDFPARDDNRELIFLLPMRPGRKSSRALSWLAPVADLLGMGSDTLYSEVIRQQVSGSTAYVAEISVEDYEALKETKLLDEAVLEKLFDFDARTYKVSPAAFFAAMPGQKLKQLTSNINPTNLVAIWKIISNCLANCLGIPRIAVEIDAESTNFSSWRNVMAMTKDRRAVLHEWWITQWSLPIYRHRIRNVAASQTPLGEKCRAYLQAKSSGKKITKAALESLLKVNWSYPGDEYIEPVKEATGHAIQRAEGLTTDRKWCRTQHAMAWPKFVDELVTDKQIALTRAFMAQIEMLVQFGATLAEAKSHILTQVKALHYTELCPLPRPKAAHVTMPIEADPPKAEAPAALPAPAAAPAASGGEK